MADLKKDRACSGQLKTRSGKLYPQATSPPLLVAMQYLAEQLICFLCIKSRGQKSRLQAEC